MFAICVCHPLISITAPSLPPSLPPLIFTCISHLCCFISSLSVSLPPQFTDDVTPCITHHELLRWNRALFCCQTKSQTFSSPLVPLLLPSLPSLWFFSFFGSLILTSGSRSDQRFLRVTWDLAFFHSFGANLEEFGHCNPAAHASLVTAGGRVLKDRLTAHIHVHRLQYLAGVEPS